MATFATFASDFSIVFWESYAVIYTAPMNTEWTDSSTKRRKHFARLRSASMAFVAAAILAGIMAIVFSARAQEQDQKQDQSAPDASDIAEGMRLFQQKGNCQSCHGWAGDGRNMDSQMPSGANLRETKLSRAGIVLTIKCGRLNAQMPAFDKYAYTDGRCYGKTKADLKSYPTKMPDPPATLQPREIDLIVDFLFAKVVGKGPMDHAKCVEFWGSETDACKDFPK
jgi:mono/diheme cytochrome c family protein